MYGLSPLARGTRQQTSYPNPPARFIPAGAGNSRNEALDCRNYAVYPRWRGELILFAAESLCRYGLSPLARGTHVTRHWTAETTRFIPAGAGNSSSSLPNPSVVTVYPRWRGELMGLKDASPSGGGLSPLARGTHRSYTRSSNAARFIPAGAGNSTHLPLSPGRGTVYPRWRGELSKHNLLLINDFLSQSQSTNFTVSHKQHIHYVKERLIH